MWLSVSHALRSNVAVATIGFDTTMEFDVGIIGFDTTREFDDERFVSEFIRGVFLEG